MGSGGAEGNDDFGLDDLDLLLDKGQKDCHLLRRGWAVVGGLSRKGRTVFADVGDVDFWTREAHGFEDLIQFFSGGADEGFLLFFFEKTGGFTDEDDVRVGVSCGEYGDGS